jgi:hypothetical protein
MSEPAELPSAQERQDFARRLGEIRATLPASQQRMLDAAIMVAFAPGAHGDVQGYEWFYGPGEPASSQRSASPRWYEGSEAAAWDETAWAAAFYAEPHEQP